MYAYLGEEIATVLLQVCWRYVETTDFVLLRELCLRSFAFVCGSFICLVIKLEVPNSKTHVTLDACTIPNVPLRLNPKFKFFSFPTKPSHHNK